MTSLLLRKDLLQRSEVVPGGKLLECFPAVAAAQIATKNAFDGLGQLVCCHTGEKLPANSLMLAKAAANKNVVGIDAFAADFGFCAEASDIADVMLSAGIRAASEMDIDGMVQLEAFFEVLDQFQSMALGIRLRKFAVAVARTGHDPTGQV